QLSSFAAGKWLAQISMLCMATSAKAEEACSRPLPLWNAQHFYASTAAWSPPILLTHHVLSQESTHLSTDKRSVALFLYQPPDDFIALEIGRPSFSPFMPKR
ncbi:hypothetical protein, partial [Stutzerimonas stutzeri]|uniref:hypothetical protein n=1 Tax=Stutzerimonas stutzeri TaxID=316 RepID=UPI00300ED42A